MRYNFFGGCTCIGLWYIYREREIYFWWSDFQIFAWEMQKVKKFEKTRFLIVNQFFNVTIGFYVQNCIYFYILINMCTFRWIIWDIEGQKSVCSRTRYYLFHRQIKSGSGTYQFLTFNITYNPSRCAYIYQNVKIYVFLDVESDGDF